MITEFEREMLKKQDAIRAAIVHASLCLGLTGFALIISLASIGVRLGTIASKL
jgi:hypothetical protein